jgi:hypothetical protein
MNERDLIATQTIRQVAEGGDAVRADAKATASALDVLAASATNLGNATESSARRQTSVAAAFNAMARAIDPASRAFETLEKNYATFGRALDQNSSMLDKAGQGLDVYRAKLEAAAVAAESLRRQQSNMMTNASATTGSIGGTSISLNQITGSSQSKVDTNQYAAQFAAMMDIADQKAAQIGKQFGESLDAGMIAGTAKSARDSAGVFSAELDRLDTISQQRAVQVGKNFQDSLDGSLIAGVGKSARDSASVFSAELDRLDTIAQQKAIQIGKNFQDDLNSSFNIGSAPKSATQSADVFKQTILAQEDAINKLRASMNPLEVEQGKLGAQSATYSAALKSGAMTTVEYAAAQKLLGNQLSEFQNAAKSAAGATEGFGLASALGSTQSMAFTAAIRHMFDAYMAGIPLTRTIAMETGNLSYAFSGAGTSLMKYVTPTNVAIAATVALGAAAVAAAVQMDRLNVSSNLALSGAGARTGTTTSDINTFVAKNTPSVFTGAGLSQKESRTLAEDMTQTGDIVISKLHNMSDAVVGFANQSKTSVDAAIKAFVGFGQDPIKAMDELGKVFGPVNQGTRDLVESFVAVGDKTSAMNAIVDGMNEKFKASAQHMGAAESAWRGLANVMGTTQKPTGLETSLDNVKNKLDAAIETATKWAEAGLEAPAEVSKGVEDLSRKYEDLYARQQKVVDGKVSAVFDDIAEKARLGTNALIPEIEQLKQMEIRLNQLKAARDAGAGGPNNDAAITAQQNLIAKTQEAESESKRYNQAVAEISKSWGEVGQSTALSLQASRNQLPVIQAVGGAARMAAQEAADYANAMDRGKTSTEAAFLSAANLAAAQAAANSAAQAQTWSLQNNLAVSQAWTTATQMKAQYEATYNQLIHDGVSAETAGAAAAAQYADSKAKAVASAQKLVQSSQDNLDKIQAQGTGMEGVVASSIAYRDAIQNGATAMQANIIAANTLQASLLQVLQTQNQIDQSTASYNSQQVAAGKASGLGSFDPFATTPGKQYTSDNVDPSTSIMLRREIATKGGISPGEALALAPFGYNLPIAPPTPNSQLIDSSIAGGGVSAGIATAKSLGDISSAGTLYSILNSQTTDNAAKITNDQQFMAWLQTQPQTVESLQAISSLTSEIQSLATATGANTSATSANTDALSPYYTQDPRTSHIGFRSQGMALGGFPVPGPPSVNDNMMATFPVASGENILYVDPQFSKRGMGGGGGGGDSKTQVVNINQSFMMSGNAKDEFGRTGYQAAQTAARQLRAVG